MATKVSRRASPKTKTMDPAQVADYINKCFVDEYVELHKKVKPLAKKLEAMRKELLKTMPDGGVGHKYGFTVINTDSESLDTENIRAVMDSAWIKKFSKTIVRRTVVPFALDK